MNIKRIGKIAGISIIVLLLAVFVVMGAIMFDVLSYTATASEKLNPNGTEVGEALVVYDPGISGNSKDAALLIAKDLQVKGYAVDLAGINSVTAKNTSNYNIIVIGGPIYAGNASRSVQSYLDTIKPSKTTKIAVFAVGQDRDVLNNSEMLKKQVAPLPDNSTLKIIAVTKFIQGDDIYKDTMAFVNNLLE